MRVTHIVPALFDRERGTVGGAERYAFELARFMARRTDTTLVTFGAKAAQWHDGELRVRVLGKPWLVRGERHNPFKFKIAAEILRSDVVHCHQQHILVSTFAAALGRTLRKRVVVSDLGGGGWDISGYVSTDGLYHHHLHISEYSRKVFGHADRRNARVIYGGVDLEKFHPTETLRDTNSVLYVGRLLPHKGINYLIEAIEPPLELDIVGAPGHDEYFELLQRLATNRQVRFHLGCEDRELTALYRDALCLVLPSVFEDVYGGKTTVPELLGQTPLEAQASGRPAVCTNIASLPEVISDGETGFLVEPNSAKALRARLRDLQGDKRKANEMGRNARRWVEERFSWNAVVDRCFEAYGGA